MDFFKSCCFQILSNFAYFFPYSRPPGTCALMECKFCEEVTHPTCVTDYGVDGFIRMDLPNYWECPRCIKNKKDSKSESAGPSPEKLVKKEEPEEDKVLLQQDTSVSAIK